MKGKKGEWEFVRKDEENEEVGAASLEVEQETINGKAENMEKEGKSGSAKGKEGRMRIGRRGEENEKTERRINE